MFRPVNAVLETELAGTGDLRIACRDSVQLWRTDCNVPRSGQAAWGTKDQGLIEAEIHLGRGWWGGQFLHVLAG